VLAQSTRYNVHTSWICSGFSTGTQIAVALPPPIAVALPPIAGALPPPVAGAPEDERRLGERLGGVNAPARCFPAAPCFFLLARILFTNSLVPLVPGPPEEEQLLSASTA